MIQGTRKKQEREREKKKKGTDEEWTKQWQMINETMARVLLQGQELKQGRPSEVDDNRSYKPPSS
jgi:hypothetical protein